MRIPCLILSLAFLVPPIASQQIWDIWQTTWDRSKLFTSLKPSTPINFASPSVIGSADIDVDDTTTFQSVWGFGGTLTDSSALILSNMKAKNSANYFALLNYMFSTTDGANAAGISYIRVPLGASDFSANLYSFDDTSGDTSFNNFNIGKAPSYLYTVLKDIQSVNPIHVLPWSPPGWMKTTGSMDGGSLSSQYTSVYANYLLKCLQGFKSEGITSLYAISIQNEPQNSQSTYPTTSMTVAVHAQVGIALRALMNSNGFSAVKLIAAPNAFAGVAFHCYAWYMDNLFIGAITHNAHTALMWNIALDNGAPKLPGTSSCGGSGCRSIAQVNNDGSYSLNQEFYAMAQASKAVIPKDVGGAWGQRIGVTVGGTLNWALQVGAYVTTRVSSSDWLRYSLVVLNWNDSIGGWNPTPVTTTIEFRGMQASLTTLWYVFTSRSGDPWYAPPTSLKNATKEEPTEIYTETDGKQQRLGVFV
ncbi:glucan endo-1,6-beta-glucosidase [Mycena leptocephala]|nr:glucan endo-1,6-beta-glucosidase [Mycena leptocephala]